jgi:peptidoglycan/LPS O-acetylase OafA/YrhL
MGGLGVRVFFVISGFLITYLLISETEQTGKIDVIRFYKRRALRIWPLYFFCMITGALIFPEIMSAFTYCGNIFLGLTFLNNFDVIYYFDQCPEAQMRISWSVAIEEQFYLFWPLLFILVIRMKSIYRYLFCWALIAVSFIFAYNSTLNIKSYHTISNMGYLIVGCFGAFYFKKNPASTILDTINKNIWLIVLMTAITLSLTFYFSWFFLPGSILLAFLYLGIVVYFALCNKGEVNVFDKLGKYTYGMYFYHTIVFAGLLVLFDILHLKYNQNILLMFCVSFLTLPATIFTSILSYKILESPFLRLKKKLAVVQTR